MDRVCWAGLTQWIQPSRGINQHKTHGLLEPSRERSVPWGGLVTFPQLLLEVQHREQEGSKGKLGPASWGTPVLG